MKYSLFKYVNQKICDWLGHVDQKILIDGDGFHLSTCCFLRVRICRICKRWEIMSRAENRHAGAITWGIVR